MLHKTVKIFFVEVLREISPHKELREDNQSLFYFFLICKVVSLPLSFKCQILEKQCYLAASESPNEVSPLAVKKCIVCSVLYINHQSKGRTVNPKVRYQPLP